MAAARLIELFGKGNDMSRIVIPKANWKPQLSMTIPRLKDGDTLVLPNEQARMEAVKLLSYVRPHVLVFVDVKEA